MKKVKIKFMRLFLFAFALGFVWACSDMNDINQEYLDRGETVYAGRAFAATVFPGKERAFLKWYFIGDQRVEKCRIIWNSGKDSVDFAVTRTTDIERDSILLTNLEEKDYLFEIYSFDKFGNKSLKSQVAGTVYGSVYEKALLTRTIINAELVGTNAEITWGTISSESGVVGMEIKYTDKINVKHDTIVPAGSSKTVLKDFTKGAAFEYRTLFMPSPLAIDTFYTTYQSKPVKYDVTSDYLKNAGYPFTRAEWDGSRWGNLLDWTTNEAMRTRGGNLYGGYDNLNNSNSFGVEKWTATEAQILNGKIYQSFTVPAGKYQYLFSFGGGNAKASNSGNDPRYMVVAAGNSLPDVADVGKALAFASLVGVSSSGSMKVEFSVGQSTEISLGVVVNWTNTQQNIRAHSVRLYKVE